MFFIVCGCRTLFALLCLLLVWGFRIIKLSSYFVTRSAANALHVLIHLVLRLSKAQCWSCYSCSHFTDEDIRTQIGAQLWNRGSYVGCCAPPENADQGLSAGHDSAFDRGYLARPRDGFDCHIWRPTTGTLVEAREADQQPAEHRTPPTASCPQMSVVLRLETPVKRKHRTPTHIIDM